MSPTRHHSLPRRSLLQAGSLLLGGIGLPDLYRLRAASSQQQRDTAVILLWLEGGPSHMETYDMKPDAPVEYRGEFRSIASNVEGLDLCEHLPLQSRLADKFTLIRSVSHAITDHPGGAARFLTGYTPKNISKLTSDYPAFDTVVGKLRGDMTGATVPRFVSNTTYFKGGGPAYLGPTAQPFVFESSPHLPDYRVRDVRVAESVSHRLADRQFLLRELDRMRRALDADANVQAMDEFHERAVDLLRSSATANAFDLTRESDATRARYGHHRMGQSALLARRLVESGCAMVSLDFGRANKAFPTWDDHGDAHHIFKAMRARLPMYDQALSALIHDLYDRGLDRRVLVIATGEFGRTPKVNMGRAARPIAPGRVHWADAMSILVSGGGMPMGQVIGSTNARGEHPVDRPLDPNDFLATVYRFLGIDPSQNLLDQRGRPIPILPHGKPIRELL
ncbi:MAG: hypothetical protein CL681_12365 [Blastopirellula sp.]|nr:hypothetical protein [Blastopirellula sp.]